MISIPGNPQQIVKRLLLVILMSVPLMNLAQQTIHLPDPVKKIEVTGSAEMEVVPDEIYIAITVQEYYNKQKEKINIDAISKNFIATCEKAGISKERIEVQDMSGFDNTSWWYRKRKKEQPDLLQSTTYIVKFSNPAEVDKLVNMLDDNATQNIYLYKTSSSKQAEYRKQLKKEALQNAKAKAQYLLEGIGAKAGSVLYVKEIEQHEFPMYKGMMESNAMMAQDGSANEGLNFRKLKYRYEVEAHFVIE